MRHQTLFLAALGFSSGLFAGSAQAAEQLAVIRAEYREVAQTYSVEGVVEAVRQSTVSAQISGRVKEVNFDVGDTVKKGQVILRIDERETGQALAGSQAQVMQAQAALTQAKANYQRSMQLFEQKYISQSALDKAKADYDVALAQAAASEAGESQSALAHAYASVIAPFGGVVASRLVEMGEMVTVGKPLMVGFDPTQMRVIVNVPQYKLAEIGTHPRVNIELTSLKRWVKAAAVTVQPSADARTHSTQVRVSLPANEKGVYPGMFVRAHFVVGRAKKLLIPSSAVVRRSEVVAVYVVDDTGAARLRQVRLGEAAGENEIEVLVGLNPGENVALDPVKAGMSVAR
ncbi:MAG: efflux transporter periplasmic adaptor subunit [Gallionellales bacterium 35-53-114]|jgi:RND family efflux transporter MFP subunit|nr:MAG: efflux transporter periplasmic adaptor subunit [Gallionellales bacterium 35-53-114]OYZ64409.1 MAG: efflux transporter periplasmic adaptor subunit [Gallionellales bacterium 24-53-125]OZB10283.1 MAG: efflux transporter periplasmic adaptor subunit [Gallionellales bacterium 39-52-133]HQS56880.1 efflux RND transporter periplasmic adaptor subunit [Gallionellaceae bacterium]HQS75336.1 efflux RND transporter periplasmic adaptor subunit [Gallionellaceae bacterium]